MARGSCPRGYQSSATLEWDGAYDSNVDGAYPPRGTTRVAPTGFRTPFLAPRRLSGGGSIIGLSLRVVLTCYSRGGLVRQASAWPVVPVHSSGCPQEITWAAVARPLRMRISSPTRVSASSPFTVKVTAVNVSKSRWTGRIGFAAAPGAVDEWRSLPDLSVVKVGSRTIRASCLQAMPGGRIPSYLASLTLRPGQGATVRFTVRLGTAAPQDVMLWTLRGTVRTSGPTGTRAFVSSA